MAKVEKLTKDELAYAKNNSISSTKESNFSHAKNPQKNNVFISKLSVQEIEEFFKKFGVNFVAKIPTEKEPEFVYVQCDQFSVTFTDFVSTFNFDYSGTPDLTDKSNFNLSLFAKYCDEIEVYPDQAISHLIAVNLFGKRFPSYANAKREFDQKNQKQAFEKLPRSMQKDLGIVHEIKENENKGIYNKLTYGDCNIEEYIRRS